MPSVFSKPDGETDWKKVALVAVPVALIGLYFGYHYFNTPSKPPVPVPDRDVPNLPDSNADLKDMPPLEQSVTLKNRGNKYFKGGNYEKAIACYTEAINRCPSYNKQELSTFYQNRAAAHENLRKIPESIKDCSSALELDPAYLKAMSRRARLYENQNKLREALEDVTAVCILESFKNRESLERADRVLKGLGSSLAKEEMASRTSPQLPSHAFIRTYFSSFAHDPFLNPPDPPDGHEIPEKNGDTGKSEEEIALDEAITALLEQKYKKIQPLANTAVELMQKTNHPRLPEALLLRGTFRLLHGQSELAEEDLEAVATSKDASNEVRVSALIRKGSLIMTTYSKVEESLREFQRAMDLTRENSDIYHHRGQLYLICDRLDEALADLNKAASLSPDFSIAQAQKIYASYRSAQGKQNLAEMASSVQDFEQLCRKFPKCIESHSLFSQVLVDLGRFDEADNHFKIITETEPKSGTAYVHRGLLQLQWKQDVDSAICYMKTAIDVDPLCEFAHETLATVHVQRGDFDEALTLFAKGINLCRSPTEMAHLISLREAVLAQQRVCSRLGMTVQDLIQKNMSSLKGSGMAGMPV